MLRPDLVKLNRTKTRFSREIRTIHFFKLLFHLLPDFRYGGHVEKVGRIRVQVLVVGGGKPK